MTKLLKLLSATSLAALAGLSQVAVAQSQTDEVFALNIDLSAVSQGSPTTNRDGVVTDLSFSHITSASVIQAIGASLGQTFSYRARLEVVTPTNDFESWTVQIQDGTSAPVNVSGFFNHQPGSTVVGGSWSGPQGGQGAVDYSVDTLTLQDQAGYPSLGFHFSVSGFTTLSSSPVVNRKGAVISYNDSIFSQVSGTGDSGGNPTVVTGSLNAFGVGTETVVTSGGGQAF